LTQQLGGFLLRTLCFFSHASLNDTAPVDDRRGEAERISKKSFFAHANKFFRYLIVSQQFGPQFFKVQNTWDFRNANIRPDDSER
jgi:hypothetical protein